MARMHSRKKGKSGSTRVYGETPDFVRHKAKEIEMLVTKMAKSGKTASLIGMELRDSYGIPSVKQITGKRITKLLAEKELTKRFPEDLTNLIRRRVVISKHHKINRKDQTAKRGLKLTDSKILRLIKYYKGQNLIEPEFRFNFDQAELYLE